jgi:hypothetical protein
VSRCASSYGRIIRSDMAVLEKNASATLLSKHDPVRPRLWRIANPEQRPPHCLVCSAWVNADLLDVQATIHQVSDQIADRPVRVIDGNPRPTGLLVATQLLDRGDDVVRNLDHPVVSKRRPSRRLDLRQSR